MSSSSNTLDSLSIISPLVLTDAELSSYNRQDRTKNAQILNGGQGLQLTGDTWKKYAYSYTLTANTLLDFDFRSETPGADIQAIGFDTDDSYNRTVKEAFQIGGARVNSGYKTAFFNATGTEWQYFTLPVGQYFTGDINFLTFINDHVNTVANPQGVSVYQNIRLYERDLTDATAPLAQLGELPPITETGYSYSFQVTYSDAAGIRLSSLGNDDIEITRPDGFRYLARLTDIQANPERTQVVATYTMTSNLGWGLGVADLNGQYQITLKEGQIADFNGNLLGEQSLGALTVNVAVPPTPSPEPPPPENSINFNLTQILSYNRQDLKPSSEPLVLDGGQTLQLKGNTWKKYRYPYVITPDTVLMFEYRSDGAGEEQAIGFDTNDSYSAGDFPAFQLYGTKPSSKLYNLAYNNYSGTNWKTYEIPVGEYFTGAVEYLTFINDHDVSTPLSNSLFKNVRLFDSFELDAEAPTATVNALANIGTTTGVPDYFFTVTYQDNKGLDLNSLDSQDILVLGPNSFSTGAEFVNTTVVGNSVQALYRVVNAQNWNSSQVGEYRVELQANQVKDLSGNSAAAGTLGSFSVQFAPSLTLDPAGLSSYNSQDRTKNAQVLDGGQGLKLTGDTWKKYAYSYTLTANTLLDFDFRSETPGAAIQAIGFDTDDSYNRTVKEAFQIGGARVNSGYKTAFFNATGTEWQYFTLPVGQYFTGPVNFLTFINDHVNTVANPQGVSVYQNIRLYERDLTDTTAPSAQLGALPPITETGYSYSFQVTYSDAAGIRLSSLGNDDIKITRPDGFSYLARLTNIDANPERTQVVATYTMTSNLGWGLTAGDRNGQYQIALRQGQITDLNGNSLGQQNLGTLTVDVAVPPTSEPPVTSVTFDPAQILSYNRQDLKPSQEPLVLDGGQTLRLQGNTWKKYRYPYVITPDTVLTFDYRSDGAGEEQAIGFDTNDSYSKVDFPAFQLYGTKPSSKLYNLAYNNYSGTNWKTYEIPVGEYFTGAVEYLTFINDHDVSNPTSNSFFRNVQLADRFQDVTPPTLTVGPLKDLYFATINQPYQFSITVEDDKGLNVNSLENLVLQVSGPQGFTSEVSLVDIDLGNFGKEATLTFEIGIAHLPAYTPQSVGQYTVSSVGEDIEDINGNKLVLEEIGSFNIFAPSSIGTNLSGVRSFSPALPFMDGFKSSRPWIPQRTGVWDTGAALTLDENGWVTAWPTEPTTTQISTLLFDNVQGNYPGGEYLVLYEGEGTLTYSRNASKNVAASAPGRDVINVTPSNQGILLSITAINPENYIKNIRVIPAEAETTYTTEIFNPLYLEKIAPFSTLRFMDWGKTNDSPQVNWSDRPTLETATWMQKGVPVEIMVELANTTQSDPWFTLPHQATDDYVRNFATYVRDNLDPGLTVYVEYSNEVWNRQFDQYRWVRDQAQAEWPDSMLGEYIQVIDWYSRRTTEVTQIWDEVFDIDKERVIGVMAGRANDAGTLERALSYAWTENPLTHAEYGIDALAIAPYFGGYLGNPDYDPQLLSWIQQPDGGLDTLFAELNQGGQLVGANQTGVLNTIRQHLQSHKDLAGAEGLDWLAYESGQGLVSTARNPNPAVAELFSAANRDPRMGELYDQYLHLWNEMGGGLMVHYNDINPNSKFGSWGALESVVQAGSPKYDSLVNFINAAQASGY